MKTVPPDVRRRFGLDAVELAVETGIATIWKAQRSDTAVALKLYRDGDTKNEGPGFDLLRDLDGRGAARILDQDAGAVVLEWLDGPSLGDVVRGGDDETATRHLCEVANIIHAHPLLLRDGYQTLDTWFLALDALTFAPDCPDAVRRDFAFAKQTAHSLLASQHDIRPLHGDLHHDNIMHSGRGWLAFDAKGVVGERTYELANAMRNPVGADVLIRDPARIRRLRDDWAAAFDVDPQRLMQWVVAKSALSIAWSCKGALGRCDGDDLVGIFAAVLAD